MENDEKQKSDYNLTPREYSTMSEKEYISERLNSYKNWYDKKAVKAKRSYFSMRASTVLIGVILPFILNYKSFFNQYADMIASLLSLAVASLVSLEGVFHYREQWKNYRSTEQFLSKEYFLFTSGEGIYKAKKSKDAFMSFVERVEGAISAENTSTLSILTTISENEKSLKKGRA